LSTASDERREKKKEKRKKRTEIRNFLKMKSLITGIGK
jgi:hypothetical protein